MKKLARLMCISMILLVLLSYASLGFAVTSYYWRDTPLILNPGETAEVKAFGLQNMIGSEDIIMRVEQTSGFEVAEITDQSLDYDVPFGTKDVFVNFKITVPQDAEIGTEYNIGAIFTRINDKSRRGSVQFTAGISYNMIVVVGERIVQEIVEEVVVEVPAPREEQPSETIREERKGISGIGVAILVLIVAAIIMFYRYETNKHKKVKRRKVKR